MMETLLFLIKHHVYRHSLPETVVPPNFICLSVCPASIAYISVTMGRMLMKLDGNVGI